MTYGAIALFPRKPVWDSPGSKRQDSDDAVKGARTLKRFQLKPGISRPISLKKFASQTRFQKITWREGTKGAMTGLFAWRRVWLGGGWATGACANAPQTWLLIEKQSDSLIKYAVSNLPPNTSAIKAIQM